MKLITKTIVTLLALGTTISLTGCNKATKNNSVQTFKGYITSEDDFTAGKGQDTAKMVDMDTMAESGLGITFQSNGEWKFYYLDGNFAAKNNSGSDGSWKFDGTGAQKRAWETVEAQVKNGQGSEAVPVTVTGTLSGEKRNSPGSDKAKKTFEVITVKSITASSVMSSSDSSSMSDNSQSSSSSMSSSMAMSSQSSSEAMSSMSK